MEVRELQTGAIEQGPSFLQCFFLSLSDDKLLSLFVTISNEPCGNAMSPPKLTADTPVLNIFQPVAIGSDILGRIEFNLAFQYWWEGNVGKVFHGKEPLLAQPGLNGCVLIAFGIANFIAVILHFFQKIGFAQVNFYLAAYIHSVLADI